MHFYCNCMNSTFYSRLRPLEGHDFIAFVFYMIDINLLRPEKGGDIELVKESQRKRGGEAAVALVDEVISLDTEAIRGTPISPSQI
jgi:Seryl-tRNA synthetase N-terminal domain